MSEIAKQQKAMEPPSDSITVHKKADLPEVFRQDNRVYFKENMPNNPDDNLTVWYQPLDPETLARAKDLRALKIAFESISKCQIFL